MRAIVTIGVAVVLSLTACKTAQERRADQERKEAIENANRLLDSTRVYINKMRIKIDSMKRADYIRTL